MWLSGPKAPGIPFLWRTFISLLPFHVGVTVHHQRPPTQHVLMVPLTVRRWVQYIGYTCIGEVTSDVTGNAPHIPPKHQAPCFPAIFIEDESFTWSLSSSPPGSSGSPFDYWKRSHLTSNCTTALSSCWELHQQQRPDVSHLCSPRPRLLFLQQPQISDDCLFIWISRPKRDDARCSG